jgi:ABC-2 type transport system ATP-binding protein
LSSGSTNTGEGIGAMQAGVSAELGAPPIDGGGLAPLTAPRAMLSLEAIVRRWGRTRVLDGATLHLLPGTVAWLGGPNGSGKTTLLRIAAGIVAPQGGSIRLAGIDPEQDRRAYHRRLGFASAGDRGLYARLSVAQNLAFCAALALISPRNRAGVLRAAIDRFGLAELADQRVDRMSMGQRQRVRLAATFLHEPSVVLLDEPQTSLDEAAMALLQMALDELTARGGAALWCSPSVTAAPLRADVLHRLENGVIVPA